MDLRQLKLKYDMQVQGILHLGAHLAEEAPEYAVLFPSSNVWWVEAYDKNIARIQRKLQRYNKKQKVIQALIAEVDGVDRIFHVTNYDSMSSSMLEFGTHPEFSPDTVFVDHVVLPTKTIDTLVADYSISANFLNMDLQGCELLALKGAEKFLEGVDYIMTEINCDQVYIGAAQVEELDRFLTDFVRMEEHWVGKQGWGDGLYIRKTL